VLICGAEHGARAPQKKKTTATKTTNATTNATTRDLPI